MEWRKGPFFVSDSKTQIDIDLVHNWLSNSYWASDRSREQVQETIENSLCFGLYERDTQIGFARAVTDGVVFSWLMDVIIDESHRGKGIGQWFLSCILEHPNIKNTRMGLATKDAHGFYEKFGFRREETMRQQKMS